MKSEIAPTLSSLTSLPESQVLEMLEIPKKLEHGHLAFPVFSLAKQMRKAPPLIAAELSKQIQLPNLEAVTPVAGYVNFTFRNSFLQKTLTSSVSEKSIGFSTLGKGRTLVIDYSSPNVAKPMSIGHLRATVIGQAIRNLAESQGYKVIGINHLGDWGVQFGKLAWAYVHWGSEYPFQDKPFDSLFQLYVRFHEEAEKNPELDKQGSLYFKRLEQGDPEIKNIWKMFLEISMKEYDRIYKLLNVKFDLIQGEAFYNDLLDPTVERIKKAGLLQESEGAQVVFMDGDMPPCIIKKSDGTSLYATRDIASAIYRHEVLKGDEILYVVGVDQSLHFQQVFQVLQKMGYEWAKNCHHIAFGMYRFKDVGKMSTRKGRVIFMDDVLDRAIELVREIIEKKNPQLSESEREEVAKKVGVGAIIFNDLVNDRVRNVDFDWDTALNFEGDSGPYVQYCAVRCHSLIKKYAKTVDLNMKAELNAPEERELIRTLMNYEDALKGSFRTYRPNILAQYLLEVCRSFNHFYHQHRILGEPEAIESSRMALVESTRRILVSGLGILGIQSPEVM